MQKIKDKFREIELSQGDASEKYFHDVLQKHKDQGKLPPWLLSWEQNKKWSAADRAGIDFVIKTDRGGIKINIKSSRSFAKIFESQHKAENITPIVVNILERPETFLGRFISVIGKIYKSMP